MLVKLIEFLPLIAFFTAYKLTSDMILAAAIVVISCLISTALEYLITRSLSRMQVFLTGAVLLFGIPTVLLNDPDIIKWKVTVVNLILALAIAVCLYGFRRNPFSYLFGKEIPLPEEAWSKMAVWWCGYFVFAAMLNIVIAFYLPAIFGIDEASAEHLWVDYKTFGNAILNLIFMIISGIFIFKGHPEFLEKLKEQDQEH
ncbi:MAG: septation protein IspZ [Succinivibrio sp.]|nr:septation protein IspZ [Succinivibrio sp.]